MPTRKDWMPYALTERLLLMNNVAAKIDGCAVQLGLTAAQVARIKSIAAEAEFAIRIFESASATKKALRSWRNNVLSNIPSNKPAIERPMFDNAPAPAGTRFGVIAEFRKLVEIIKASPGFSAAIGTDLDIMSPQHTAKDIAELIPEPKVTVEDNYKVRIGGSLQGMSAMRVEYRRRVDPEWRTASFLTHLPAIIEIEPVVHGEPETGYIRCILLKRNEKAGQYSASYPVTIAVH